MTRILRKGGVFVEKTLRKLAYRLLLCMISMGATSLTMFSAAEQILLADQHQDAFFILMFCIALSVGTAACWFFDWTMSARMRGAKSAISKHYWWQADLVAEVLWIVLIFLIRSDLSRKTLYWILGVFIGIPVIVTMVATLVLITVWAKRLAPHQEEND